MKDFTIYTFGRKDAEFCSKKSQLRPEGLSAKR
jgi:hypothetical protein